MINLPVLEEFLESTYGEIRYNLTPFERASEFCGGAAPCPCNYTFLCKINEDIFDLEYHLVSFAYYN